MSYKNILLKSREGPFIIFEQLERTQLYTAGVRNCIHGMIKLCPCIILCIICTITHIYIYYIYAIRDKKNNMSEKNVF